MAIKRSEEKRHPLGLPTELAREINPAPLDAFREAEGILGPYRHELHQELITGPITWEVVVEAVRRYIDDHWPWMPRAYADRDYDDILAADVYGTGAVLYYAPKKYTRWSRAQARKVVRVLRGRLDPESLRPVTRRFLDWVATKRWAKWAGARLATEPESLGELSTATSPAVSAGLREEFIAEMEPRLWDDFVRFCSPERTFPAVNAAHDSFGYCGMDLPIGGVFTVDGDHPGSSARYSIIQPLLSLTFLQIHFDEKGSGVRVVPV